MEFVNFMEHLNNCHFTIKFTHESSATEVSYLDLNLVKQGSTIYVKPHFKNTNTFSYVPTTSYHHTTIFKAIYRRENIRILRYCSKESDYESTVEFIRTKFTNTHYGQLVQTIIPFQDRVNFLVPSQRPVSSTVTIVSHLDFTKQFVRKLAII